ncbi:uncharacterized protein RJT20DRAFT_10521 [Scheffersomyces xylosifermentans]|uniref:uncharacterized protein n=1 Tax=Scheffersomyces xylosifermentans TaxID=1304137 RepID=UPI00315D5601
MSIYQRKVNNYEQRKHDLVHSYLALRDKFVSIDDPDHRLENTYEVLLQLDEILYEYRVVKSYLENRSDLTSNDKLLLDKMDALATRLEKLLPIPDIISRVQELAILRRQINENAREASKILNLYEHSDPRAKRFIEPSTPGSRPKENIALGKWDDGGWSKEHVRVVFDSARLKKTTFERSEFIKQTFEEKFKTAISSKAANYLLLHYGFRDTGVNLKTFHSVMDDAFVLNQQLSTYPRADAISDYFKQKVGINVSKNECTYVAKFREIMMKFYNSPREPEENYKEFEDQAPFLNTHMTHIIHDS